MSLEQPPLLFPFRTRKIGKQFITFDKQIQLIIINYLKKIKTSINIISHCMGHALCKHNYPTTIFVYPLTKHVFE